MKQNDKRFSYILYAYQQSKDNRIDEEVMAEHLEICYNIQYDEYVKFRQITNTDEL